MAATFLAALPLIGKALDRILPDPQQRAEAQYKLMELAQRGEFKELEAAVNVIVAEAKSEHWLTSTWRPALMYTFIFIIANNYILAPYISLLFSVKIILEIPVDMWELLKLGVGGYVIGRSAETISSNYMKAKSTQALP